MHPEGAALAARMVIFFHLVGERNILSAIIKVLRPEMQTTPKSPLPEGVSAARVVVEYKILPLILQRHNAFSSPALREAKNTEVIKLLIKKNRQSADAN